MRKQSLGMIGVIAAVATSISFAQVDGLECWDDALLGASGQIDDLLKSIDADGDLGAATTSSALYLFEINFAGQPALIGPVPGASGARRVKIDGDLVATIIGDDTVRLYDISDPAIPVLAAEIAGLSLGDLAAPLGDFGPTSDPIKLIGSTLYTVANTGVSIYDVSNPVSPALVGNVSYPMAAFGIEVAGGIAYVADRVEGLHTFDVSTPSSPVHLGSTSGMPAADLAVSGNTVYLCPGLIEIFGSFNDAMFVVDCADPSIPTQVGTVSIPDGAISAAVDGNTLYVTTHLSLEVFDITNAIAPSRLRRASSVDYSGSISRVVASDASVLVSGFNQILSFERNNPTAGDAWVADLLSGSNVVHHVAGEVLYTWSEPSAELAAIDISDPTSPATLGMLSLAGSLSGVSGIITGDGIIYLQTSGNEFWAIDITDPAAMFSAGNWQFAVTDLYEVVSQGGYLYGANWFGGLRIMDVSDPGSAGTALLFPMSSGTEFFEIAVRDDLALLGGHEQTPGQDSYRLVAVDISDPALPVFLGEWVTFSHDIKDITFIDDETVIVLGGPHADHPDGNSSLLRTLDVSDPANIAEISSVELGTDFFASGFFSVTVPETDVALSDRAVFMAVNLNSVFGAGPSAQAVFRTDVLPDGSLAPSVSFPLRYTGSAIQSLRATASHVITSTGDTFRTRCGSPPCPADLSEPIGTLNFFDVAQFITLYNAGDLAADFAAPFGTLNFFDVSAYIIAYNAGCP